MQNYTNESKFSIIRWVLTALPLCLMFTDYFTLQAYLLKLYEPSPEYISAGWTY